MGCNGLHKLHTHVQGLGIKIAEYGNMLLSLETYFSLFLEVNYWSISIAVSMKVIIMYAN